MKIYRILSIEVDVRNLRVIEDAALIELFVTDLAFLTVKISNEVFSWLWYVFVLRIAHNLVHDIVIFKLCDAPSRGYPVPF